MMQTLSRKDLWSLEEYSEKRSEFRAKVLQHKRHRQLDLGGNARLYFEDRMTIQYQIQEMLRIERIFEAAAIEEELEAYNPLIPDGSNWKATFMLEYPDVNERKHMLSLLVGIEDRVWVKIGNTDKIYAIADEDMDRSNQDKTSSVHFLRFELAPEHLNEAAHDAVISFGVDHPQFNFPPVNLGQELRQALMADLQLPESH